MTALAGDFRDYHDQVGMGEAVRRAFANYATFRGRANRGEYWWFALASLLINVVVTVLDASLFGTMAGGIPVLSPLWTLVAFLPSLALSVRRLHDVDRSGWALLVALIPVVGIILLLIWVCTRGEPRPNRFG